MHLTALGLALAAALSGTPATVQPTQTALPQPIPKVETVRDVVAAYFADIPIMVTISGCESHYRQYDTDGLVFRGEINHHDVGVMQINEDYHLEDAKALGYDLYTTEGNLAFARYLYEHEGTAPWLSSAYCWDPARYSANKLAAK